MADPLSGISIIICIAFGILTFVLLFIFANRQIKRFSLKSKSGPHAPIAQGAPKCLLKELNRRLDVVKNIAYHPPLLKKSDEIYFQDDIPFHRPVHLHRMKAIDSISNLDSAILAVDSTKTRPYNQDYRVFLVRLFQSGLFGQLEISTIHRYCDLYEIARHEPIDFNKEHFIEFTELMSQIQQSISTRPSNRQHVTSRPGPSSHSDPSRHFNNGKVPAVPSCLQVESVVEDKKSTFETSV